MNRLYLQLLLLTGSFGILSGCQMGPDGSHDTVALLEVRQLKRTAIAAGKFQLLAFEPQTKQSNTLRLYIEGDGRAWLKRGIASSDPTPRNRLVHRLMQADPTDDLAYLGRPCQFIQNSACHKQVWTFGRYNSDTLDSMNAAVSYFKKKHNYQKFELIGYSGGATIALLLAAERNDITSVRTVAGNLDPAFTNQLHQVTPMPESLRPADNQKILTKVPQIHFFGQNDSVIPAQVSNYYIEQFPDSSCISITGVPDASHGHHWARQWRSLLGRTPTCKKAN